MTTCTYCGGSRKNNKTFHGCVEAQAAKKRLSEALCHIDDTQRGGQELSDERSRLNQIDDMRRAIKLLEDTSL